MAFNGFFPWTKAVRPNHLILVFSLSSIAFVHYNSFYYSLFHFDLNMALELTALASCKIFVLSVLTLKKLTKIYSLPSINPNNHCPPVSSHSTTPQKSKACRSVSFSKCPMRWAAGADDLVVGAAASTTHASD